MAGALGLFDRLVQALACALLACLMACIIAGVVTRGLGAPLTWTDEGARFLMVWLAAAGWILSTRRRAHVRIRFFQGLLPAPGWHGTEMAIQALLALFGLVVAGLAVGLVRRNLDLDATSLPISMAWLYLPLIPAGLATAAQAAADLVRRPGAPGSPR